VDGRDKPGHDELNTKRRLETDQVMLFTSNHEDARRGLKKFIAVETK
jgi:hypothetical protein